MNLNPISKPIFGVLTLLLLLSLNGCHVKKNLQTALEKANLAKAVYCMELIENQKDLEGARRDCFAEQYIQHTPWVPDGREAVLALFKNRFKKYPDYAMDIKRTAADGDLVWMHMHTQRAPDARGNAVINVFRMKGGKFVEHWNVVQPVPEVSKNDNTMF